MNRKDRALLVFLEALEFVEARGFSTEVDWGRARRVDDVDAVVFLEETAWVVLSSGMRESVVRRVFPRIRSAFLDFELARIVAEDPSALVREARRWFNHPRKLSGILEAAEWIAADGVGAILDFVESDGPEVLCRIPFVGPATCFHLARNVGIPVSKPDRHLVRIAGALGFGTPHELCESVAKRTGETPGVVDLVLWRFATLVDDYEAWLRNPAARPARQIGLVQ